MPASLDRAFVRSNVAFSPEFAELMKYPVEAVEVARFLHISVRAEPIRFLNLRARHHSGTDHDRKPVVPRIGAYRLQNRQSGLLSHAIIQANDSVRLMKFRRP